MRFHKEINYIVEWLDAMSEIGPGSVNGAQSDYFRSFFLCNFEMESDGCDQQP